MNIETFLKEGVRRRGDEYINIHTGAIIPKEFVEKYTKLYGVEIKEVEE